MPLSSTLPLGVTASNNQHRWKIVVSDNVHVTDPLIIDWTQEDGEGWDLVAGRGSKITIVEELKGLIEKHAVNVDLKENASADIVSVENLDASAACSIVQKGIIARGASCQWRNVTIGGRSVTHSLTSRLESDDAVSNIDWMFYAKREEKYKLTVRNVFLGKHGGGEITMRGVAEQKGHVQCNGMIEIGSNGGQTDTYLTQEVLMLDKTSKVDAIPGLEIKTNDVKASHSATVSRVTEEDLFYFATRGIPEHESRRMFVEGFLGDLVSKIASESVQSHILELVEKKFASKA